MDIIVALNEIGQIVFQLLCRGFFVRGGLVVGDIYHKGNICYGPALVKCVNLEGKAIYPIISLDSSFFNEESNDSVYYGRNSLSRKNREYLEDTYHCVNIREKSSELTMDIGSVRRSSEYTHFLDYLDINIDYDEQVALHIKSIIESELKKDYSEHIAGKYKWIRDYYNSIVCQSQCMETVKIEI